jgi:hypothetical protein
VNIDIDVLVIVIKPIEVLNHQSHDLIANLLVPGCVLEDISNAFIVISIA